MNTKKSKMSLILEASTITKTDKYYNMKQFINNVKGYIQTRAEDSFSLISRDLQLISNTTDLSSFDPHTSIIAEFFVNLHELLSIVEPSSTLAWCCVKVLITACKNSATRTALINTYQFVPLLSRILGDHLTIKKKIRLLMLMQELTCGIKVSWQIPHLPHLMATLTSWIESGQEEIVTLSLAILINLCYKNLPSVHTLSGCVDIKKFARMCMPLKGPKIELHVCKLLIILDYMNGKVPEEVFLKFIDVTFKSMIEAFRIRDSALLRQVVEFFFDLWDQSNHGKILQAFGKYDVEVDNLVSELENVSQSDDEEMSTVNPQCVILIFEFLDFIMKLRQPNVPSLDLRLVNLTLKWIQVDPVCFAALAILRSVAINATEESYIILDPFLTSLPIFLLEIENREDEIPTHVENNKRLGVLMELLRGLMKIETTRNRVLAMLKEDLFAKIFMPLTGCSVSNVNTSSAEAVLLYVNSIALIHDILRYDERWITFFNELIQHKQIHMILAQALYNGSQETKTVILGMSSSVHFPIKQVSATMCQLQPITQTDSKYKESNILYQSMPLMPVTQIERLDEIINKIKESFQQNNLLNISTSDIMELYEYKLATMTHAERTALASLEAASVRCTHLQHRIAQLTSELTRLHQILLHTQQRYEDALKTKEAVLSNNKQLQEFLDAEKMKYASQLSLKEQIINEKTKILVDATKQLKDLEQEKDVLKDKYSELNRVVTKLEENLVKKEKLLEEKGESLLRANANIENLKGKIQKTDNELATRTRELSEVTKELHSCKSILGTITQLTSSQFAKHN